jgi:hypothetical protein
VQAKPEPVIEQAAEPTPVEPTPIEQPAKELTMVRAVFGDMVDLMTGTRITLQPTPCVMNGFIQSQIDAGKMVLVQ